MADAEKKYTEREMVLAKREAGYEMAIAWVGEYNERCSCTACTPKATNIQADAVRRYPLPLVTRPRVVSDIANVDWCREFRCVAGRIEQREVRGDNRSLTWAPIAGGWEITPRTVRFFADLLANPTEQVPDDPANDTSRDALEREVL